MSVSGRGIWNIISSGVRELRVRPKGQVPALDALRSFAILGVLGVHWAEGQYERAGGVPTSIAHLPIFSAGWTGVDLFFVLSGYLIGKQLWRELQRTGTINFTRFVMKRGFRIWPLYFVTMFVVWLAFGSVSIIDLVFLTNYIPGKALGITWSLSTEEQFYIAVPLLLLAFRKRIKPIHFLWVFLVIEVLVIVVRHQTILRVLQPGDTINDHRYQLFLPFHTHMEGLLAGLVISLISTFAPHWMPKANEGQVSRIGVVVLFAAFACAIAMRLIDHKLFAFLELGLIFGALAFWALLDQSWMSAPLRLWFWYPISRLAYGMYLNHFWTTRPANRFAVAVSQHLTSSSGVVFILSLILASAASFAVAAVTFVLVEHPFLILRERFTSRSTQEPAREAAAA